MLRSLQSSCKGAKDWKFIDIFADAGFASSNFSYQNYFNPNLRFKNSLFDICKNIKNRKSRDNVIVHHHSMIDISEHLDISEYIVLIRDPLERALSHWRHTVKKNNVDISFEEFVNTFPHTINHQSFWINNLISHNIEKNIIWVEDYHIYGKKTQQLAEKMGFISIKPQHYNKTKTDRSLAVLSETDKRFINTEYMQKIINLEKNFLVRVAK